MPTTTRAAIVARITAQMRAAGLQPIGPYPGEATRRWWCHCVCCGHPNVPATWSSVRKGCDPCPHCTRERRAASWCASRNAA